MAFFRLRILEWVAMLSSRRSSQPRDWTWIFCIGRRFFTTSTGTPSLNVSGEIGCHFLALRPQAPWFCIASASPAPLVLSINLEIHLWLSHLGDRKAKSEARLLSSLQPTRAAVALSHAFPAKLLTNRSPAFSVSALSPRFHPPLGNMCAPPGHRRLLSAWLFWRFGAL